jgi:two-component system sensor histidine kinase RegB
MTLRRVRPRSFRLDALRLDEGPIGLDWLIRLRWVAIVAQVVTVGFALPMLHAPAVTVPLLVAVATALAIANVDAARKLGLQLGNEERLQVQLAIDILALTALFELTGGATNPFVSLYLIHVAMGAILLRPARAVQLGALVTVCFALVSVVHLPLAWADHPVDEAALRRAGHLIAFTITVFSVLGFVLGLAEALRTHRQQLLTRRDHTARTDRLRSVGTLAAGAAHELNTPLSTIQMRVSRLARRHAEPATQADVEVVRAQVDRCKKVVEQLLVGAGDPSASGLDRVALAELVIDAVDLWQHGAGVEVGLSDEADGAEVEVPRIAFVHGLINLLQNALEAQAEIGASHAIGVRLGRDGPRTFVEVTDRGVGLPPEQNQLGEPFFTTKDSGTGLGVYVARAVAEGSGGGLTYRANEPSGTVATWWFPVAGDPVTVG